MRKCVFFLVVLAILAFQMGPLTDAQADAVGRLTQVEGRVDILRGGQLPATPVKVDDGVQTGDVLRTKSLSKAQITFIDNSTLTISPESRVSIEAYMFDSAQNKRNAVIQLFQGLAHVVVSKVYQSAEPDFAVKTQTAIMGVRGTDFGVRLHPNSSEILNFEGRLQVGNIFPEVSQLLRRAFKVAYSFGSGAGGGNQWIFLNNMQGTTVARGLPPTLPYGLTSQDRDMFMRQLISTAPAGPKSYQGQESARGATGTGPFSSTTPVSAIGQGEQTTLAILNTITVPPPVVGTAVQTAPQPQPASTPSLGVAIPVFNILMAWGAGARDLDLHLTGPQGSSTFHVYYGNSGSLTTQPYALLNADNTGTSGSEVITVQQFNQGGLYQASVFNYGNQSTTSTNLSTTSGVSLSVINGGTVVATGGGSTVQGGSIVTSLTPTPNLAGNTWQAISINPATGQVTQVNQITNTTNGVPTSLTLAAAALTSAELSTAPAAASAAPVATVAAPAVLSAAPVAAVATPAVVSAASVATRAAPVATVAAPAVLSAAPVAAVANPAVVSTVPAATSASTAAR
jgi:hypothetical protein